jgi:shikimate dehydrogenase
MRRGRLGLRGVTDGERCAAAVLGSPIEHSLSPVLHRAAYAALDLSGWSYDAVECGVDGLADVLDTAPPMFVGFSCTMPLKREALRCAATASEDAERIGSANTLLRRPDGWYAENTDWTGIRLALQDCGAEVKDRRVAIAGAGGTAQAALRAVLDADTVDILVRDVARTGEILLAAERLGRSVSVSPLPGPQTLNAADIVLSTLPPRAADPLGEYAWRPNQIVLDAAYDPWPSELSRQVMSGGGTVVSGAVMLLFQAARQVELMTGRPAPVRAMREALRAAHPASGI